MIWARHGVMLIFDLFWEQNILVYVLKFDLYYNIWLSGTWILTYRRPLLPHRILWRPLDRSNSCALHRAWASAWLLDPQHFGRASATAQATPGCWFAEGNLRFSNCASFFPVMEVFWMFFVFSFSIACDCLFGWNFEHSRWITKLIHDSKPKRDVIGQSFWSGDRVRPCPHGHKRASIEQQVYICTRHDIVTETGKSVAVLPLFQVASALLLWVTFLSSIQL